MRAPTLAEVLTNQAPPPYTLSAFMAFLSQNHCLETLEFTLDASRYQSYYYSLQQIPPIPGSDEANRLRNSWDRLISAYIKPGAMREVNLAASDRDFLIRIPNTYTPPSPEALDGAVFKITELMRDSVLSPFLQSCEQKQRQERDFLSFSSQLSQGSSSNVTSGGSKIPYTHSQSYPGAVPTTSQWPRSHEQQALSQQTLRTQHCQPSQTFQPSHAGLSQLFGGHARRIVRPSSARPTSVPSADFVTAPDNWSTNTGEDSDMSGSEDPITPPHTPPASGSPSSSAPQWRSKIKNQFSKMNGNRAKTREQH